jgi:hypothetical protein
MSLKLFSGFLNQRDAERRARRYRDLIRQEAKIGGELFGSVPQGGRREFFCLDRSTWVWHEEWFDKHGKHHAITTRYDIRPAGILKAQDGHPYHYIGYEEAKHFAKAVHLYNRRIRRELYGLAA